MRLRQDVKAKPLLHAAKLHHVFFYEEATIPWRIAHKVSYGKGLFIRLKAIVKIFLPKS